MQATEHYALNLFEGSDHVLAESFNANTEIIDAALAEKICGTSWTYTGDGQRGKSFTFPSQPLVVFVSENERELGRMGVAVYGSRELRMNAGNNTAVTQTRCTWSGTTLTLEPGNASDGADVCFNRSGATYQLVALLA